MKSENRETESEMVRVAAVSAPEGKDISPGFVRALLEVEPEETEMLDESILKIAKLGSICSVTYEKAEGRVTIDFLGNEELIVFSFGVFVHRTFLDVGEDDIEEVCKLYPISELLKVAELIREQSFIGNLD